jgi:hypothetical protein
MTLVIAAIGRESIWVAADRRLSADGKPVADDAVKVLSLERDSDVALLAYSGLGKTPKGMQPSDWMNAVLRGRNEPLERSLEVIAGAIGREMPKYLLQVPDLGSAAHVVLAPAFVSDKPTMYSLRLDIDRKTKDVKVAAHRHETMEGPRRYARIGLAGSGAPVLVGQVGRLRGLLRLIRKHERNRISAHFVAKQFAALNQEVANKVGSVGPDCIVAWRYRRNGLLKGGGAHMSFSGTDQKNGEALYLPSNTNGGDLSGLLRAVGPMMMDHMSKIMDGKDEPFDDAAANEILKTLPRGPNEKL